MKLKAKAIIQLKDQLAKVTIVPAETLTFIGKICKTKMFYHFRDEKVIFTLTRSLCWFLTSDMMIHGKPPMPTANAEMKPCFI